MSISDLAKRVAKLAADNSPAILTTIGVAGTVTTAYLAGNATYKYTKLLGEQGFFDQETTFERTPREHLEESWKFYIPAVGTGLLTVVCIIGANRIGTRRAAAMAAAYTISEKMFEEYRGKVVEKIGAPKEQALRDELAQDRVRANPSKEVIVLGNGGVLCYDMYTGRYFSSTMEELKKAQNDLNYRVLNNFYASLTEFYDLLGLPRTSMTDEVGWNSDKLLELRFSTVLSENSEPCLAVDFAVVPIRDYYRVS